MSYATQADVIARLSGGEEDLIRLTDRADPPLEMVDVAVLASAQVDATATINSFVSVKYSLPLTPVPATLVGVECDLIIFNLMRGRPSEAVQKARDDAMRYLRDVSAGKASIGVDAGNTAPAESGGVFVHSGTPVFTPETLGDY